jgi:hypothetical protein
MMLQTEIKIQPLEQTIRYGDGLLFLGSCFANEVGNLCKGLGFNAMVNPFGELYNPSSIALALKWLYTGTPFTHEDVIEVGNGFYCTFNHNTSFWRPSERELLETVNQALEKAHEHYEKTKWVVISLGTSWVFRHKTTGDVVANCHKLPADQFERAFFTLGQSTHCLTELFRGNFDKQFIFTVSPLRHLKDGLHENQLSKAALLLAVDQVCKDFPNAHYFPAYEILLDELRDYRFYKEDMVHPTDQAVRYIWERFVDFAIDAKEKPIMKKASELKQMLCHKAFFPESEAYRKFEAQKEQRIAELRQLCPALRMDYLSEP